MFNTDRYIRIKYCNGGRDILDPRGVDCWGLYLGILYLERNIQLDLHGEVVSHSATARRLQAEAVSGNWKQIPFGQETTYDLILMTGYLHSPSGYTALPMHVGCVWIPGVMIDIEETTGTMVRAYRDTAQQRALPTVTNRVLSAWRHKALEIAE